MATLEVVVVSVEDREVFETVAEIYGYESYTAFHQNVSHTTYDKQSLVDLAAAKGWTVVTRLFLLNSFNKT